MPIEVSQNPDSNPGLIIIPQINKKIIAIKIKVPIPFGLLWPSELPPLTG